VPDILPAFSSLTTEERGCTWAEVFVPEHEREDAPGTWIVFDADDRARGTVETPTGLDVTEVETDYVLGVWTSELDVEQVRLHTLRGPEEGR